jgi:hypothetical protein
VLSDSEKLPSTNVTVPGAKAVSRAGCAVTTRSLAIPRPRTDVEAREGLAVAAILAAEGAVTVTVNAAEAEAAVVLFPGKLAVTVCTPTASVVTFSEATPSGSRVELPKIAPRSKKLTVPLAVSAGAYSTAAVNVTVAPKTTLAGVAVSEVVVAMSGLVPALPLEAPPHQASAPSPTELTNARRTALARNRVWRFGLAGR